MLFVSASTPVPDARTRLAAAAIDAFAARGFHGTTTRDISTAAGMSPAALYVHYPSKEQLLYEISRSGHLDALAALRAVPDMQPAERLRIARELEKPKCSPNKLPLP